MVLILPSFLDPPRPVQASFTGLTLLSWLLAASCPEGVYSTLASYGVTLDKQVFSANDHKEMSPKRPIMAPFMECHV